MRRWWMLGLGLCLLAGPGQADEQGVCGQWTGEIEFVIDTGEDQTWANRFAEGDALRGYFMKRGVPARLQMTENTNPWHQHVNTVEFFGDHADWAMNVNVNGHVFENDSHVPTENEFRMRVTRYDTTRNPLYGDRHDHITWWTDYVAVSDEIAYFPRYSMAVKFEGTDAMNVTPNGMSASAADLDPALLTHLIGRDNPVEAYGRVILFSHGGFDGYAQIAGRVTGVQPFPCSMVSFDPETGQYGLVGSPPGGSDN